MLHSYLRQLVADLNVLVEPCTPRMANQKGAVENLVGFVKKNFFLAYPFANRADVIAQLPQWLHRVIHERPSDATGEISAMRLEQELPRLNARPIPWTAADLPLRESATVSPTGAVCSDFISGDSVGNQAKLAHVIRATTNDAYRDRITFCNTATSDTIVGDLFADNMSSFFESMELDEISSLWIFETSIHTRVFVPSSDFNFRCVINKSPIYEPL